MAEDKTAEQLLGEVKTLVDTKLNETKAAAEELKGKMDAADQVTAGLVQKFDEAFKEHNEAKARLDELEQKVARQREVESFAKSIGQNVTDDANVQAFLASGVKGNVSVNIESKAIISSLTTAANGSAGDLIVPARVPGVHGVANRVLSVRDLLMPGQTSSNSVQYVQETSYTNSAATVSETAGTTKAQSEMYFDIVTSNVTTIAHWVQATRQILDDVPMLQSYINGRLIYGLKYVEDNQLLNGAGTGTDLNGIYTQATASTANLAVITSPTKIDVIRAAMLQATLANLPASGIVLHPTDWFGIETTKDSAGNYIIGDPQQSASPRLWGLPVVSTPAMTTGKFLTGAFDMGAQIFDRQEARVEISTEDGNNFVKNLVTILCEERLALAVYNTLAFVKGDFAAQITDLTS
jgi:HK97 family phage major capsid protein